MSTFSGERPRTMCLSFAGAGEGFPFDEATSVFKVAGKMFALGCLECGANGWAG